MPSDFYIHHSKSIKLSEKAVDWLIKSWRWEKDTPEYQICMLKRKMYRRDSAEELL